MAGKNRQKESGEELVLIWSPREDTGMGNDYYHPVLRVGYWNPADHRVRTAGSHDPLACLQVSAQADNRTELPDIYGWEVVYHDCWRIGLGRAEEMARTLRTVQTKLTKLDSTFGEAGSYEAYVARVCNALGIKYVARTSTTSTSMGPNEYILMGMSDATSWIRHAILDWREMHKLVTQPA